MIKENDFVKTLVEKYNIRIGTKGIVVGTHNDGEAFEIEILDNEEYPIDVHMYEKNEIEKIQK